MELFGSDVLSWLAEGSLDQQLVEQLMVTRLIFEPNIAALAAVNATGHDLAALEDACKLMSQGQQQASRQLFEQGDMAFHLALLGASHNPFCIHWAAHFPRPWRSLSSKRWKKISG